MFHRLVAGVLRREEEHAAEVARFHHGMGEVAADTLHAVYLRSTDRAHHTGSLGAFWSGQYLAPAQQMNGDTDSHNDYGA